MATEIDVNEINERIENIHRYLNKHKEYLNSLNVFPVPDGDTGLNMVLTLQGAMANMKNFENQSMLPGEYLKNFAEQMLLNSRGCSGVILSLFMQGFAEVVKNSDFSKQNVYRAIENGYRNAYEGTENPREGTMLTLMRALKEKYAELMKEEEDPIVIISKTIPYLKEVLNQTPEMLPVLKQAGVIDSGGAGFVVFIQGINRELQHNGFGTNGLSVPTLLKIGKATRKHIKMRLSKFKNTPFAHLISNIDFSRIQNSRLQEILQNVRKITTNLSVNNHVNSKKTLQKRIINELEEINNLWNPDIKQKYCTEFVLESDKIASKEQLREMISAFGDSLIIIQAGNKFKVHIHTNKPDDIFDRVQPYGELVFTKVDDMKKQHRNFISDDVIDYRRDKSIFCIVSGKGFAEILQKLGADDILCYGKNKPSVDQLAKGLDNLQAKNIIAAADDGDILMALKYAVSLCKSNVYIVESDNPIALIGMMMGISKDYDIMTMFEEAMKNINTIPFCGIARANREVLADNEMTVRKNDYFAVYKKKIVLSNPNMEELAVEAIRQLANGCGLVTLYKGLPSRKENGLVDRLKEQFPDTDFEEYYGGQYNYNYYITFE
ncbi:DAK2 domain-containing protein [Anaerorudis cellulosivorans]|uniref:DAK2 domain-containing protein n=1 Tax=Anaerorudis cellulosivorans TaxID=3397862 RepID=UPI00221F281B|nr:DAK2 domain-containing protein [Seramator thermalis]MCW1735664.1 DAK2 domain-containing protein [Seramator thermalis]